MSDEPTADGVLIFGGEPHRRRSWVSALSRGLRKKCPNCGVGTIFTGYTKTRESCPACRLNISGHRADDAPPYVTILIVGHLLIPLALAIKQIFDPAIGVQYMIWFPVTAVSAAWLLPVVKGGFIGLQWANYMHGFAKTKFDPDWTE